MDLSNSQNLKTTPNLEGTQNLERLDLTGCINLSQVHPSIGLLEKLVFLSLQNCCSLVSFEFGSNRSKLGCLRVLHLSGCTKLEKSPDLTGAEILEYLDMDRCTSLSTVHESIGYRKKLRFLSLRDCTNLVGLPDSIDFMSSLMTLDLCGCSEFMNLPLQSTINSSAMESLVSLDLSFCSILEVPNAIGRLWCLERLNLQGNNFVELPSTISSLHRLAYLNLSHCSKLTYLPRLPSECAPLVGRYFETTSEYRDHRSGLYIFNCPIVRVNLNFKLPYGTPSNLEDLSDWWRSTLYPWILRLFTEPCNFRCGFDIVCPWHWEDGGHYKRNDIIPEWFTRRFKGGSIIRTRFSRTNVAWVGFIFCVAFQVNNHSAISGSPHRSHSSPLPHPFYLSFESEYTEERFDMPLNLRRDKSDGSKYLWIIYISRQHCHFVATQAQITFKAHKSLIVEEWGLRILSSKDMKFPGRFHHRSSLVIDYVEESNKSFVPKIQLPYNWLLSDEDEVNIHNIKGKEINLSNLGL